MAGREGVIVIVLIALSNVAVSVVVQVIKNTQQSAIKEGATETMTVIPKKEGRRRQGAEQGNSEVEDYCNRGAQGNSQHIPA
jgi:hypothetical protein